MRRPTLRFSESNLLVLLAVVIGVAVGLTAVGLERLLVVTREAFFWTADRFAFLGDYRIAVAPVLGALVAGPLVYRLAREAKGHGVPEVMEAVALRGGRIRPRVAIVKTAASALTIGSGGSAGREGPIVQIGATIGSTIGQAFRMSERRMRTLVAAGAAAGIAAAFNAPLAGVFFALEVILQRFTARGFATVVLSAVTASVVWRAFFGNAPVFAVPFYSLRHPVELAFYFVLGVLAAVVAVAFVKVLYWLEDRFDALRMPGDLKPALGAIVTGLLGVWSILVLGSGIEGTNMALSGELAVGMLLLLLVAKVVATSFTLGSGGSGGVFSPSLFVGAMLGGAFGHVLHQIFPNATATEGAYALVGMGAVFAAAAQAPMTSILIIFEMTNDFRIMVPLMLAVVTATIAYQLLTRDSIYMAKLRRRGVELQQGRELHLLETLPVSQAVDREPEVLKLPASMEEAATQLERADHDIVLVTPTGRKLLGAIYPQTLRAALEEGSEDVDAVVMRDVPTVTLRDTLDTALRRLTLQDLEALPVVDGEGRIVGVATREAIMRAYRNALIEHERSSRP